MNELRLSFGAVSEQRIRDGISRLGRVLAME
jgi:DNA-binding transcriptional MocR family regulator